MDGNIHAKNCVDHVVACEPIAIVGAACRLPGEASSLQGLWHLISNGRSAHRRVPPERWNAEAWYHPDPDHKGTVRLDLSSSRAAGDSVLQTDALQSKLSTTSGFFLQEDVSLFDAPFFSTTAKEAAGMDPAKRLLLEVAYEAFENGETSNVAPCDFISHIVHD